MARAALVAARRLAQRGAEADFHRAKIATARFYADFHLPQALALKHAVLTAGEAVLALADEQF
jgi:butyryl-CoA dehydrogenase